MRWKSIAMRAKAEPEKELADHDDHNDRTEWCSFDVYNNFEDEDVNKSDLESI